MDKLITLQLASEILSVSKWYIRRLSEDILPVYEEFSGRSYLANKYTVISIPVINFYIELPPQVIELKDKKFQILSEDLILEEYSNELKSIHSYDVFYLNLYYNNPVTIVKKLYGSRFEFFTDCYLDVLKNIF